MLDKLAAPCDLKPKFLYFLFPHVHHPLLYLYLLFHCKACLVPWEISGGQVLSLSLKQEKYLRHRKLPLHSNEWLKQGLKAVWFQNLHCSHKALLPPGVINQNPQWCWLKGSFLGHPRAHDSEFCCQQGAFNLVYQGEDRDEVLYRSNMSVLQLKVSKSHEITIVIIILLFRATPKTYRGSQARGLIRATAASLRHSHSNAWSEPQLWPTPQLMATPDPSPTEWSQGSNPQPHGSYSDSFLLRHNRNSPDLNF